MCQQEAISSANDFVHRPKFSQLSPKFKDAIEKIWRPTIFLSGDKLCCSLKAILRQVILFHVHDQVPLLDISG